MADSFLFIIRAFYSVFVILPEPDDSRYRRLFSFVLDCLVFACLLQVVINDCCTVYNFFGSYPFGFILSAMSGDFCSMGVRITLIRKSKLIVYAIRQMFSCQLASKIKKSEYATLIVAYCVCWAIPIAYIYRDIQYLRLEGGEEFSQRTILFGYYWNKTWVTFLAMFLKFIGAHQVYALPFCCVLLCYYACRLLTKAIKQTEKNLKWMRDLTELSSAFVETTRKLSKCLEDIETALSFLLMLLYCYLISCIFIVTTSMIRVWPKRFIPLEASSNILIFFVSLAAFFLLSMQAANVHNAAVDLKRTVYRSCAKLSFRIRNEDDNVRFLLLTMANAFEEKTVVTVWNLFDLNRSFILQTSGAVITYAIIIAQLGTTK